MRFVCMCVRVCCMHVRVCCVLLSDLTIYFALLARDRCAYRASSVASVWQSSFEPFLKHCLKRAEGNVRFDGQMSFSYRISFDFPSDISR